MDGVRRESMRQERRCDLHGVSLFLRGNHDRDIPGGVITSYVESMYGKFTYHTSIYQVDL